jgi:hypothetical protein
MWFIISMQWQNCEAGLKPLILIEGKASESSFIDAKDAVLVDYSESGAAITGNYHAKLIGKLCQAIRNKRLGT